MNRSLWPHQTEGIAMLRHSLGSGHRRPMLASPTGSGKTLLTAAIVDGALRKGKRVCFIVPAISLINQTVKAFYDEGISDVGVIQASHPMTNPSRPVQVASVQTLHRRERPKADLFVIDEAHILHKTHKDFLSDEALKSVPMIGLSATPWRKGLGKFYDDLLIVTTTQRLIDDGLLSRFKVFAPSHPDLSGVRTVAGDYHEGDLGDTMNTSPLVADVVSNWLTNGEGRPTLCFAVDRAHAKHLQEQFLAAGVPAGYIDCNVSGEDREPILKQFRRGDVKVICNVGTMTTGIDLDVRCLILARPTKSESLFVQIIGRSLRTALGKDHAIIFDHSDTHARLGFVTDIHHDKLDDGSGPGEAKPRPKPMPKECPSCHFLRPAKVSLCPACGFKPTRQCDVEVEDGELIELGAASRENRHAAKAEQQRWFSMLLGVAETRGYKPGWAAANFRDKFGHWPDGLDKRPCEPSPEVVSWVRHKMIQFAKRRAA